MLLGRGCHAGWRVGDVVGGDTPSAGSYSVDFVGHTTAAAISGYRVQLDGVAPESNGCIWEAGASTRRRHGHAARCGLAMNATERLALSRERIRQVMLRPGVSSGQADRERPSNTSPDWLSKLRAMPAVSLLMTIFDGWWARQPLRLALTLAAQTGTVILQPTAQKHPLKLVLAAAVAGGLLAALRPWRWIPTSALLAGLIPQLVSEVLKRRSVPR